MLTERLRYWLHGAVITGMRVVAPMTHFIPEDVRHRFVRRVNRFLEARTLRRMRFEPWRKGAFPDGANLMGYLHAGIGLGQGARMYARALAGTGLPFRLVDVPLPDAPPPTDDGYSGADGTEPEYAVNIIHINPDMLSYVFANTPQRYWNGRCNVGVWLWELEELPQEWVHCLRFFEEIWAPSTFVAEAVRRSAQIPVRVVPYGIEQEAPVYGRSHFGLPEDCFLVLAMYDTQSYAERKNPMGAVRAFAQAFGDGGSNARLVLKMNNANAEEIARIRSLPGAERMILLTDRMTRSEVTSLIAASDVFLSLHRSEGFGLVIAEAMAQAVPVVATEYSANTDFMDGSCACPVRYTLTDVNGAYMYGQKGVRWAEPDIGHAAEQLRRLYGDKALRRRIGLAGQKRIREEFSVERSSERMRACLEELLRGNRARRKEEEA